MTNEQQHEAMRLVKITQKEVQRLIDGQDSAAQKLEKRWQHIDWSLCYLLKHLIPVLPQEIQAQVQTCCDLREQAWSTEYINQYFVTQKQASPQCLQAQDSL